MKHESLKQREQRVGYILEHQQKTPNHDQPAFKNVDEEMGFQIALQRALEKELRLAELMSERAVVRKELRECKEKIKELNEKKMKISVMMS